LVKPYPDPLKRKVRAVKVVLMKSIILCKGEGKDKPLTYGMGNKFAKKRANRPDPLALCIF